MDAARIRALLSVRITFLPLVMPTVLKLLVDWFRVMSFAAPAARVVAPATLRAFDWLRLPLARVALRAPVSVTAPLKIISLPAVIPALVKAREPAVMACRVISPLVLLVLPVPGRRSMLTAPLPALMLVPAAMVMTAAPLSRLALTTPLARLSLAMAVKLPLSVVMAALSKMLRPAWKVRAPPLPPVLLALKAAFRVRSLLACRVTAVPALSRAVRSSVYRVEEAVGLSL